MLRKFVQANLLIVLRRCSTAASAELTPLTSIQNKNSNDASSSISNKLQQLPQTVPRTDLSDISKILRPGALSSIYVNKSDILQQLVKLGVKLYKIEKNPEGMKVILSLKFDEVKETIIFLNEIGLETNQIGYIITKNPFILQQDLEDLKVRINYLQYKKFSPSMIKRIIEKNPYWLSYSTQEIDSNLGFFQSSFSLTGDEVRKLATTGPKIITYSINKIKLNIFVLKEQFGLSPQEMKSVILRRPQLLVNNQQKLLDTFEYLHNVMKISIEDIIKTPQILSCRAKRLKERYIFLNKLGRVQFDPKKPSYVSLLTLVTGTDSYFSTEIAKSSVQIYNDFLKSMD